MIQKPFRWMQQLFRASQKLCCQKLFGWIRKLSSLDSETLSLDSNTFFGGFRDFFRWIQKLFFVGFRNIFRRIQKLFFIGFKNFFRWIQKLFRWIQKLLRRIQKLFSSDSDIVPTTDATQELGQESGGVGWGGMITFFGLEHMVHSTQHPRLVGFGEALHIEILSNLFLLLASDSETLVHAVDSPALPSTDATERFGPRVGWGGTIMFFGLNTRSIHRTFG